MGDGCKPLKQILTRLCGFALSCLDLGYLKSVSKDAFALAGFRASTFQTLWRSGSPGPIRFWASLWWWVDGVSPPINILMILLNVFIFFRSPTAVSVRQADCLTHLYQ